MIFRSRCWFSLFHWTWAVVVLLGLGDLTYLGVAAQRNTEDPSTGVSPIFFNAEWRLQSITLGLPTTLLIVLDRDQVADRNDWPDLVLCQTNASAGQLVTGENSWSVLQLNNTCNDGVSFNGRRCSARRQTIVTTFSLGPEPGVFTKMFFCLGIIASTGPANVQCQSHSPIFNINSATPSTESLITAPPEAGSTPEEFPILPAEPLTILRQLQVLAASDMVTSTANQTSDQGVASPGADTSGPPSVTPANEGIPSPSDDTSFPSASPGESASNRQGNSLPAGAIAGIVLGVLAFIALLLILALLFLRRIKRARARSADPLHYKHDIPETQPSHVLLSHHTHNSSWDTAAEKEMTILSTSAVERPGNYHTRNQHSTSSISNNPSGGFQVQRSPFEDVVHSPEMPSTALSPRPASSSISRAISNASGIISPRSVKARQSDTFPGMDVADSRYLRSMNMTAEELEEERRIDLAIAEAEAKKKRGLARK